MSNIEPEVKDFLQRIVWSIFIGIIWLFINVTAGIFAGWFFFYDTPTIGNYIFYTWFIISLAAMLYFFYRTWRKRFPHG